MLLRGIRWRLGGSLLTLLTAAIAVGAAVLGPLYLQTAGDSVVRSTVAAAPVGTSAIGFAPLATAQIGAGKLEAERRVLNASFGLGRWYGAPITTALSGVDLTSSHGSPLSAQLLSRTGICAVLSFSSGGCHLGPGEVLLSKRSAEQLGVAVGGSFDAKVHGVHQPILLRVAGIYRVPNEGLAYWFGEGGSYFPYGLTTGPRGSSSLEIDDMVASQATALAVPPVDAPAITIQAALRPGTVSLGDAGTLEHALAAAKHAAAGQGVAVSGGLPALLAGADHQRHLMTTIVAIAAVQLVLLAIWVLAALLLRSADQRRAELRVARLRGFPLASIVAVSVTEPALLCATGALVGVIAAWTVVLIAKNILFYSATTVSLDIWVVVAFAAALVTIAGVLAVSALRLVRGSGLGQINPATASKGGRGRAVVDAAILVLSIVALVALATSGALASHGNPIASAAPGLLALGSAVIAIRVVQFLCRRGVGATLDSHSVSTFLALRQIVRRPALLRESRVLIIALCLACFATSAWSVARSNRATAATFSVGATAVATVQPQGVGLQQAVDRVDPQGRFAMAAVQINTSSTNLLAVDAPRLAAVASWPGGVARQDAQAVSRVLAPPTAPQVSLPATTVTVSANTVGAGAPSAGLGQVDLSLWLFNQSEGTNIVSLGRLRLGARSYSAPLSGSCPGGCRLVGIGLVPTSGRGLPASGQIELKLGAFSARARSGSQTPIAADLAASDWRAASGLRVQAGTAGAAFVIPAAALGNYEGALGSLTQAMFTVADAPAALPGVAGANALYTASLSGGEATIPSQGLDGNTIAIDPRISALAVPRLGSNAEMVDLTLLTRTQIDPDVPGATDEVWLGPNAPSDALVRLGAAGLRVESVERSQTVFNRLQHTGAALAYDFMLFATIVALLAAAVSTLGVLAASTRQRATELSALEVAGVGRGVLVRSLVLESAILALTALCGAGAGAVGAALAIPSLPQLGAVAVAPLSYALPVGLILLVALCVIAVVAVTTAIATGGILNRMSPTLLRAAPNDAG